MGRNVRASVSTRHDEKLKSEYVVCQLELNPFLLEFSLTELKLSNHFSIFSVIYIFFERKLLYFTGIVYST